MVITAPTSRAAADRKLRSVAMRGPRCPDCAGPLVFGEGCQVCPVCGYSACGPEAAIIAPNARRS